MAEVRVSIGEVKRDISELVNRVAYGGAQVVLTSRGKPKAVLISVEDYERLKQAPAGAPLAHWDAWLAASEQLSRQIMERRGGEYLAVGELLQSGREDLEQRDAGTVGD